MSDSAARYRHAFIVTYGRSGSTLLQGVLNALPGYLIRGENYDAMRHLEILFNRLPRSPGQYGADAAAAPSQARDPFYGFEAFADAPVAAGIAALLQHLLLSGADPAGVRCLGFKEIRYTPQNIALKVQFLRRVFPGCAVIYNTRAPRDVIQSEFQKDKEIGYFEEFNALLEARSEADPDAFLVRYEDVTRVAGTLIGLHDFLREPFDRERIGAVLAVKHSYHTPAEGQFYANFPRFVEVAKNLPGLSLLVVDRFETLPDRVRIGGLLVPRPGQAARHVTQVVDEQGRSVKFRASFDQPSPGLAKRLAAEGADNARFELSYPRGGSDEHRLYLDGGELAVTVRSDPTPPA